MAQPTEPTARDWLSPVLDDLVELKLELEIEQIQSMKKTKIQVIGKRSCKEKSLLILSNKKRWKEILKMGGSNIVQRSLYCRVS